MQRTRFATPWLWCLGSQPEAAIRVFCVPCAGHGASMYFSWPNQLPRQIEVWAIQPPGRENRLEEVPFADLRPLVSEAATALEPLLDGRPFAIVGHSMGALVGFELTRELRRRGRPLPHRLFVSGRGAPQQPSTGPIRYDLPDAAFLTTVQQLNTAMNGDGAYADAVRFMLPTLRADFTLCECYQYVDERPLPCDLTVWGGDEDAEAGLTQLVGWREQTTGSFSLNMFRGDHFFLMTQKAAVLAALAEELEPLLGAASSENRSRNKCRTVVGA